MKTSSALAGAGDTSVDIDASVHVNDTAGAGTNFQSEITNEVSGPGSNIGTGSVQTSAVCDSGSMSDAGGSLGSRCFGMGGGSTPTPTPAGGKKGDKTGDEKKDNAEDKAAQQAAACRSQYQSALQSCDSAISSSDTTCDENNNQEMQSAAKSANQTKNNAESAVQQTCGQAGNISDDAKKAVTSYRGKCSSAVQSCTSACGQLTNFLRSNPSCYTAIGMDSGKAQSIASEKNGKCSANQAKVDQADQSISNYAKTGTASDACQMASLGGQSANSGQAGSTGMSAFCSANPAFPGCSGANKADCNDPSQASNTVCICSKNPNDAACRGATQTADSFGASSIDSASRLPAATDNGGEMPNLPGLTQAEKPKSSGSGEDVGGRQGSGSPVGDAKVGDGGPSRNTAVAPAEEESEGLLAGFFGGGKGVGAKIASRQPLGATAAAADKAKPGDPKDQTPDLRQFLPGGLANPRYNGITGSVRVGIDGITGPHTDIWKKIQNRYQVLQNSLEP